MLPKDPSACAQRIGFGQECLISFFMKKLLFGLGLGFQLLSFAQAPDSVYMQNIKTPKLFTANDQNGYPLIPVGSIGNLELHFDDLDGYVKQYYYTFQLCDADWTPVQILTPFEYINGFLQQRISTYRASSVSATKYIHYSAILPDRNCAPKRSGNYLLKVFRNADTSQLAFTKRMLVYEDKMQLGVSITQPFNPNLIRSHHKIIVNVNTQELDVINPAQQMRIKVLQNNRWDNAVTISQPTFFRGRSNMEYSNEDNLAFAAGKEWRWVDLRSFRFQSDRVKSVEMKNNIPYVNVTPDLSRINVRYLYYRDLNGRYNIQTTELINPWWQSDYAYVNFTYKPDGDQPFINKDVYLFGELTNFATGDSSRMIFNADLGVYEKTLYLKMGFYNYAIVTKGREANAAVELTSTEGNWWETEDQYMVLVYYRPIGSYVDELIGVTRAGSLFYRNSQLGVGF
jgi:hypothetical protein